MLSLRTPDLREALDRAAGEGLQHVVPAGTLIRTGRCRDKSPASAASP